MPTPQRFREMWQGLDCQNDWRPEWQRRVESYSEPWRRYHIMPHIADMFGELDTVYDKLERPIEAYWKAMDHDVVYETMRDGRVVTNSELRSAAYNADTLRRAAVVYQPITRIGLGIMATKGHVTDDLSNDDKFVVCADLAILGSPWPRYVQYRRDVEWEWLYGKQLTARQFAQGRVSLFLEPFLSRPLIFPVEPFTSRYEQRAQQNLRRELEFQKHRLLFLPS